MDWVRFKVPIKFSAVEGDGRWNDSGRKNELLLPNGPPSARSDSNLRCASDYCTRRQDTPREDPIDALEITGL